MSMPSQKVFTSRHALHNRLALVAQNDKSSLKCQKRCLGFFGCRCNQINLLVLSLQYTLKLRQLVKLFSLNSNEFSLFFTKSKVTKTISFRPLVFSIQSYHANRPQLHRCQWFISPYVGKFPYPLLSWTICQKFSCTMYPTVDIQVVSSL